MNDYILYGDTDSLYVDINRFIIDNIDDESKWIDMTDDRKIDIISRVAESVKNYVNDKINSDVRNVEYNSAVDDFNIQFETEKIAKTALFIAKKRYAYWMVVDGGVPVDKVIAKGLEIIRSDCSEAIRIRLRELYSKIMKMESYDDIKKYISDSIEMLYRVYPDEIAANISINNIDKYVKANGPIKGTPWHIKGVYNYRLLLRELNIQNLYEDLNDGQKARVVYLKNNRYNLESISFDVWPREFNDVVSVDYEKMIEKFFINKIRFLLKAMGKDDLLEMANQNKIVNLFFS